MKTYYDHGINWIWYLDATINEDATVTIHNHYRIHKYEGDKHPEGVGAYHLVEDDKRNVTHAVLLGVTYTVINSEYIFSYGNK